MEEIKVWLKDGTFKVIKVSELPKLIDDCTEIEGNISENIIKEIISKGVVVIKDRNSSIFKVFLGQKRKKLKIKKIKEKEVKK